MDSLSADEASGSNEARLVAFAVCFSHEEHATFGPAWNEREDEASARTQSTQPCPRDLLDPRTNVDEVYRLLGFRTGTRFDRGMRPPRQIPPCGGSELRVNFERADRANTPTSRPRGSRVLRLVQGRLR